MKPVKTKTWLELLAVFYQERHGGPLEYNNDDEAYALKRLAEWLEEHDIFLTPS